MQILQYGHFSSAVASYLISRTLRNNPTRNVNYPSSPTNLLSGDLTWERADELRWAPWANGQKFLYAHRPVKRIVFLTFQLVEHENWFCLS